MVARKGLSKRTAAVLLTAGLTALLAGWSAGSARAAGLIFWGDESNTGIFYANLDNSGGGASLPLTGASAPSEPSGTTIDAAAGKIYWIGQGQTVVSWANLDGSGGGDLNTGTATVNNASGIAIDPASGKIYWANESGDSIGFANLNGSGGGNLDLSGATPNKPSGLAIDPATGKVYWANFGNNTISFANLDNTGGGGQLDITGATPVGPAGMAIDQANGKIYWSNYNGNTISFANLNNTGGGGELATPGVTLTSPWGMAIDPAAGKIYWADANGPDLAFANLDGSGGGNLSAAPLTLGFPDFPSLLEPPAATAAPAVSGHSVSGSTLSCSQGSWAADLLESFLYRVPQGYGYSWTRNGSPVAGATASSVTANAPGSYVCHVTASNRAGSTTASSTAFAVRPAVKVSTASIGNQKITLTTPSVCVSRSGRLVATAASKKKASGAKLTFSSVAFFIDKGVKHKRHQGKKLVVTYSPNAVKRHVPVTVHLSLAGLKSGTHTLKVVFSYKETKRKNGHKTTVKVTKTLKVKFSIC